MREAEAEKPLDLKSIVDNLQRLSQHIPGFPEIKEFDTNPQVLEEGKGELTVDIHVGLLKRNVRYS